MFALFLKHITVSHHKAMRDMMLFYSHQYPILNKHRL